MVFTVYPVCGAICVCAVGATI